MQRNSKKKKVVDPNGPGYPRLGEVNLERRRLFTLLGGAASLTLLGACGMDIAGGLQPPNYFTTRLPGTGHQSVHLSEDGLLAYVVWVQHSSRPFGDYLARNAADILRLLSRHLQKFGYDQFADAGRLSKVSQSVSSFLADLYDSGTGKDAKIMSSRVEVVRLQKLHRSPGAAPAPGWPEE